MKKKMLDSVVREGFFGKVTNLELFNEIFQEQPKLLCSQSYKTVKIGLVDRKIWELKTLKSLSTWIWAYDSWKMGEFMKRLWFVQNLPANLPKLLHSTQFSVFPDFYSYVTFWKKKKFWIPTDQLFLKAW